MTNYVTVLVTIIGALQAISVAVIVGLFNRDARKRKIDAERVEKRAQIRADESELAMNLLSASMVLAMETGRAIKTGSTNGAMDNAIEKAQSAKNKHQEFLSRIAKGQLAQDF